MFSELTIAIIAGLGGMFGWGLADFFAKKTIDTVGDIVSLVWAHVFGTLALLVIIGFQMIFVDTYNFTLPSRNDLFLLIFFGILQGLVYIYVYKGFGKGKVSVLSPIFASFSGFVTVYSIIFLGELVDISILITLVGIFLGVIFLSIDTNISKISELNFVHTPGAKDVVIATILAAFWTITWDKFIGGEDWVIFAFFMYLFMTIALLIYSKLSKVDLSFGGNSKIWKFLVFIGIAEVIAYLAISYGYSSTKFTSVVALLSGAFSLPVIILARIFLAEKISKIQVMGIVLVIFGTMLLV